MNQHTELIKQLEASAAMMPADAAIALAYKAATAAIREQALEIERLRKDAERYRWLKERKSLDLRSDCSVWTGEDGRRFIASHFLAAGNTQFAALESLDETIDAAKKAQP